MAQNERPLVVYSRPELVRFKGPTGRTLYEVGYVSQADGQYVPVDGTLRAFETREAAEAFLAERDATWSA